MGRKLCLSYWWLVVVLLIHHLILPLVVVSSTNLSSSYLIGPSSKTSILQGMLGFGSKLKTVFNQTTDSIEQMEKKAVQLPTPYPITYIKPKIVFYRIGGQQYEMDYDANPKQVATYLSQNGYLNTERLIFLTHGFHNNFNTEWLAQYKDTILNEAAGRKAKQTVAILGWGNGADVLLVWYRQAAANVVVVGQWFAPYIQRIKEVKPETVIYGIGHSLGAHVMGVAGRESKGFDRITGLDPAGPCFEKVENSQTLKAGDARFVDVIHTDGYDSKWDPSEWFFPVNHYGSLVPIGTLDFYPNFGYHQPGAGTFVVAGSHLRALDLFQWSITNRGKFVTSLVLSSTPDFNEPVDSYVATKTPAEMGFYADRWPLPPLNSSTLYYIKTNKKAPWV